MVVGEVGAGKDEEDNGRAQLKMEMASLKMP